MVFINYVYSQSLFLEFENTIRRMASLLNAVQHERYYIDYNIVIKKTVAIIVIQNNI